MGAYVSVSQCPNGSTEMCTSNFNISDGNLSVGTYLRGQVPANPDIAGIGIISVFIAVTSFALAMSVIDLFWRLWKLFRGLPPREHRLSLTKICETLVMSCSDQQVFTGGAYAICLRYWNGCSITAYHYNVVANMMLLTCATHLVSITIVRNYWESLWQSILRVTIIICVVLVTGVMLSNQDANTDIRFPTTPPPQNETDIGLLFLPAACFQGQNTHLVDTLRDSFNGTDDFQQSLLFSTAGRGNHIQGWNEYLIMLAWYILSFLVSVIRRFYHIQRDEGFVAAIGRTFIPCCCFVRKPDRESEEDSKTSSHVIFRWMHTLYMLIGVAIGFAIVITSGDFILKLRGWVKHSGWLQPELGGIGGQGGIDPEDDPTSFGQLVPIFLSLLTIFTLAQAVNAMWDNRHRQRHPNTVSQVNDTSSSPDSETKPLGGKHPGAQDMAVPVASSGSTLGHQYYFWVPQEPNAPSTQSAMAYAEAMRSTRSTSGLNTAARYECDSPMQDTSLNTHTASPTNSIPPVTPARVSPAQLRHTSSAFSTVSCPSSQPLWQSPGPWAQPSQEASYFPAQAPLPSGSNFSIPRKAV